MSDRVLNTRLESSKYFKNITKCNSPVENQTDNIFGKTSTIRHVRACIREFEMLVFQKRFVYARNGCSIGISS